MKLAEALRGAHATIRLGLSDFRVVSKTGDEALEAAVNRILERSQVSLDLPVEELLEVLKAKPEVSE